MELTTDLQTNGLSLLRFGQEATGEIYVVTSNGMVSRIEAE